MQAYMIREVNTGKLIEAHDELSKEWGADKVAMHNKLYPADQWKMIAEIV